MTRDASERTSLFRNGSVVAGIDSFEAAGHHQRGLQLAPVWKSTSELGYDVSSCVCFDGAVPDIIIAEASQMSIHAIGNSDPQTQNGVDARGITTPSRRRSYGSTSRRWRGHQFDSRLGGTMPASIVKVNGLKYAIEKGQLYRNKADVESMSLVEDASALPGGRRPISHGQRAAKATGFSKPPGAGLVEEGWLGRVTWNLALVWISRAGQAVCGGATSASRWPSAGWSSVLLRDGVRLNL